MDIDPREVMDIISPMIENYKTELVNFAKSRFLIAAQEFGMNEKESAELSAIADSIEVEVSFNGGSVSFDITYGNSPYLDIIQNGMPAPVAGGDGGIAMNPDGSTYQSEVNPKFWGNPIDSFAKQGKDVVGEIGIMAVTIGKNIVNDAIETCKEEIALRVEAKLIPTIGGVS